MSFASALNVLRPTLPYYLALTKYGLLRITEDAFEFHPNPAAPPIALEMARAVFTMGASSCIESYVMSRTLAEGPKVFAFDALTCEALENFDLSVSTADYLQPFPSVVIELPEDYTRKRVVPFDAGQHAPDFLIARHEPEAGCVLVAMHLTSHQVMTRLLEARPGLDAGGDVGEGGTGLGGGGLAGHDAGGDGPGQRPEQAGPERVPDGDGLRGALPGAAEPVAPRAAEAVCEAGPEAGAGAAGEGRAGSCGRSPVRYAFAQEVTLYRREQARSHRRAAEGRLDGFAALAEGALAGSAVRGGAAGAAAGGHPLGAGERPPVRGIAERHDDDVPGAGMIGLV